MTNPSKSSLVEQLTAMESAWYGLADSAKIDDKLSEVRSYVANQIAAIILSDELVGEIQSMPSGMPRVLAGQTVHELCTSIFGATDYTCDWVESRQWLGNAIQAASESSPRQ